MDDLVRASVIERSILVGGHEVSVGLEDAFWEALDEITDGQEVTRSDLITIIDSDRDLSVDLSSAIRVFVLDFYRERPVAEREISQPSSAIAPSSSRAASCQCFSREDPTRYSRPDLLDWAALDPAGSRSDDQRATGCDIEQS
jgi:predicted DNA-binding ribbon-helix-helix protein